MIGVKLESKRYSQEAVLDSSNLNTIKGSIVLSFNKGNKDLGKQKQSESITRELSLKGWGSINKKSDERESFNESNMSINTPSAMKQKPIYNPMLIKKFQKPPQQVMTLKKVESPKIVQTKSKRASIETESP